MAGSVSSEKFPMLNAGLFEQLGIRGDAVMNLINAEVSRQSLMIAYIDIFWAMAWAAMLALPFLLVTKRFVFNAGAPKPAMDSH